MKVREAILAALRGDPDLVPKVRDSLRERIDEEKGPMSTVVQAAEALEPIISEAVEKRPSRLGKFGLKSAHLLASLTAEDEKSNRKLATIARGATVGIVFVDIADFTSFTAEKGDKEARALVAKLTTMVERAARAGKGELVKHLGDGFLLAFPSAYQAVKGAMHLAHAVEREKAKDGEFPVQLRIAVHAGEPLVEGDDLLGHDVNLTARLLDHCKPGRIIISEAAKELAGRRLRSAQFVKPRSVKIRGLTSRVNAYSVERSAGS